MPRVPRHLSSNPRVLVAHPGTQHSHLLARELENSGQLGEFWTGFALSSAFAERWLRSKFLRRLFCRRIIADIPSEKLRIAPFNELRALAAVRMGRDANWTIHRRNERFQNKVKQTSIEQSDVVIGFDTCSWLLASRCKKAGVPFILEQTTPHPVTKIGIFQFLESNYPEWIRAGHSKPPALIEIEMLEHQLADIIVVPSRYAGATLTDNGVDTLKIRRIPFGVNTQLFKPGDPGPATATRPLRFVYAGQISAMKGVPVLLEAWKNIPRGTAELVLVGQAPDVVQNLISDLPGVIHVPPLPQSDLAHLLGQCDVFVFPSFFEGLARVLLEAMACGLPVIASTASGGCDVIEPEKNGLLMEAGDVAGLVEAIRYFIAHPEKLPAMKNSARARAEEFSWSRYGAQWQQLIQELV